MTVLEFQNALKDELEEITKDMIFKNPEGEPAHMRAFCQTLPIRNHDIQGDYEGSEDDYVEEQDPYPFCIIRVTEGDTPDAVSAQFVKTFIIIAVFDDSNENRGHEQILSVIHRFQDRFYKNNTLAGQYAMRDPDGGQDIKWSLSDEDAFPYFFGGIECQWTLPQYRKEDALS